MFPLPFFRRASLAFMLAAPMVSASAVTIVDWNGDYVTANRNNTQTSTTVGGTTIDVYSTTNIQPTAATYTPPAGKTGPFYGGAYVTADSGTAPVLLSRVVNDTTGNPPQDQMSYRVNGITGTTFSGEGFFAFLKSDFLNGANAAPISFDLNSSIAYTPSNAATTARVAVLNGGQWYLSQTVTANAATTLSGATLLATNFGTFDPNGGANGRLGAAPTVFDTPASSFSDIQGVGYFGVSTPAVSGAYQFGTTSFTVVASSAPEPSSIALMGVGAALAGVAWRRRHGQAVG